MKILNKEGFYKADKQTIAKQGINSSDLMERAATQIFEWLKMQLQERSPKLHIFCGIGNNGGDGLVLARLLLNEGYKVMVWVVNFSDKRSDDFLLNLDRLKENKCWPGFLNKDSDLPEIGQNEMVIDAIFGIGLNRPPKVWVKAIIQHINKSKQYIISIDLPSGLYLDAVPEDKKAIIKANATISFQLPKLIFFLPETSHYAGFVQLIDIGMDPQVIAKIEAEGMLIGKQEVQNLYKGRTKFTHKGIYGHCVIMGGSYGKIGSVILASKAALRIGAGKVTAVVPKCGYQILQTSLPEAMVITTAAEDNLTEINLDFKPESIGFGIGAGTAPETVKCFEKLLKNNKNPLLIDADGLNILAENPKLLKLLPPKSILTPHIGELKRLLGEWKDDFDKLEKSKQFSEKHKVILVIKDAYTITIAHKNMYVNTTGNPGMATAGSGDVLTGIISGLLAQGYDPAIAAVLGVYLHGNAGDIAVEMSSEEALIASDLIKNIGRAYRALVKLGKVE